MESPNPGITGLFLFFIINYHLSCLIYSVCAYALASSCLPLSLINLIENSAICEMFLLHFIPSAIITDICQIIFRSNVSLCFFRIFSLVGAEIILCCDLLCFVGIQIIQILSCHISCISVIHHFIYHRHRRLCQNTYAWSNISYSSG